MSHINNSCLISEKEEEEEEGGRRSGGRGEGAKIRRGEEGRVSKRGSEVVARWCDCMQR